MDEAFEALTLLQTGKTHLDRSVAEPYSPDRGSLLLPKNLI